MERDNKVNRYSPETRARAVRMVFDNEGSYADQATAIKAIAPKIGCVGLSRNTPIQAAGVA